MITYIGEGRQLGVWVKSKAEVEGVEEQLPNVIITNMMPLPFPPLFYPAPTLASIRADSPLALPCMSSACHSPKSHGNCP